MNDLEKQLAEANKTIEAYRDAYSKEIGEMMKHQDFFTYYKLEFYLKHGRLPEKDFWKHVTKD